MNAYNNNPYHAFPLEMHGTYCQLTQGDDIIFISIFYVKYDKERVDFDKKRGIYNDTPIKKMLDKVKEVVDENELFFIYTLESYKLKKNLLPINNAWDFHGLTHEYDQQLFINLNTLTAYCEERWGITLEDFVPVYKTDIP